MYRLDLITARLPRLALTLILAAYLALGALYAIQTPKWQAPDEPAHFNYIREIAETGALPVLQRGDYDHAYLEKIKAAKFPPTLPIDAIRYEAYQPPLYYLAAAPVYLAARAGGVDAQVLALRLFSVALGVMALLVAFAVVRAIFPGDHLLALATVGAIAAVPMRLAVSASISNDTAAEFVLALILLLAVKRIHSPLSTLQFSILGGILFGAALLTKTTTYAPGALLLVASEVWRVTRDASSSVSVTSLKARFHVSHFTFHSSHSTFNALRPTLYVFALALLIASPMLIRGALTYGVTDPLGIARHDAIVVGQPTTAEMLARVGLSRVLGNWLAITFRSFWAQFGWMGVLVDERIYVALALLTGVAVFGFVLYALRIARRGEQLSAARWGSGCLLALMTFAVVVDYILYNFKFFQPQGRYLFPALIPLALFGVLGVREIVAREYRRVVFALLYAALLALDVGCLFLFVVPQLRIAN